MTADDTRFSAIHPPGKRSIKHLCIERGFYKTNIQESKKEAKTIDLCNNPLTKTPKLVAAKRIVPEWESYDKIIDDFEKELEQEDLESTK